ncbi:hypothetical protein LCC91_09980 [Tepidimonas taiwanensis]|uniref:Uncharacterized protein n=1 Tax=Tepidimonas taiwanensis TaxID=307486 RepID=A0A554XE95_9BURK|nr:hypothetical protein [Tepidimonas taiwanensis]TSE34145.1 hypothetical protein Ttaiw_00206 [Tepidimonas taiwanensis]UBQ04884.1 hypothetical protein LCC91_09980 [Tepidimonas taiwanensis]
MQIREHQQTAAAWHPDAMLRRRDILEGTRHHPPLLRIGVTKFHALINEGKLPRPVHIGRAAFWRAGDLIEAMRRLSAEAKD